MAEFRENKDVRRPFLSAPDARVYFPASIIEKARRDAVRCLKRGEGVAIVVGDAGVGKTLLSRVIAADFDADDLVAVVSASRKFTVKAFLQQLLFGLHQTFVGGDETELRLMALDYLERAPQRRHVILIDDAQNLSLRVFDEIRMLVDHAEPPAQLSVALFGTPDLEDRLNLPVLYPFAQRVVTRAWLDAFTNDETGKFIAHELKRAEVSAKFTKAAKKLVAELSAGAPRVVVQLCDRALFLAGENAPVVRDGKKPKPLEIDEDGVRAAWRNLQSIAEDVEELRPAVNDGESVVEFGELDDDDSAGYDEKTGEEHPSAFFEGFAAAIAKEKENAQSAAEEEAAAAADADPAAEPELSAQEREHAERRRAAREGFWSQEDAFVPLVSVGSNADVDAEEEEEEAPSAELEDDVEAREATSGQNDPEEIDADLEARILARLNAAFVGANAADEAAESEEEEESAADAEAETPAEIEAQGDANAEPASELEPQAQAQTDAEDAEEEEEAEPEAPVVVTETFEAPEATGEAQEIDADLEARILARLNASFVGGADDENGNIVDEEEEAPAEDFDPIEALDALSADLDAAPLEARRVEPMNFELVTEDGESYTTTSRGLSDAAFVRPDGSDVTHKRIPDLWEQGGTFDEALELNSAFPPTYESRKSVTRKPITSTDDGSAAFSAANGFSPDDTAYLSADDSNLESQFGKLPNGSSLHGWSDAAGTPDPDDLVGENHAYRQIVASCYRSSSDFPASDQYLAELRLLEQEIEEEANLIRRIRNIHLQLRAVRDPNAAAAAAKDDDARNAPGSMQSN